MGDKARKPAGKAIGPFESDAAVLKWLDENLEMMQRAEIHPRLGGGAFVMVRPDSEDEA